MLGDPEAAAGAVERLRDLLVEVDDYLRRRWPAHHAADPFDLLGFRQWLFEQVVGQLRGPSRTVAERDPRDPCCPGGGGRRRERVIVRRTGSIDLSTAATLWTSIFEAHGGGRDVTVDLTGVDFVDSVGLYVLSVAADQRFVADGRLIDFVVPGHLLRTFEITGLTQVLLLRPGN